jgi:4'-phosphopantetheinyl transferase
MNVYWLEQTDSDVPADNDWLSPGEKLSFARMRFPKRRDDWRLGRWTAKCAVAACRNIPCDLLALADIEIRAATSGAPELFLVNEPAPLSISISHRSGVALCAVTLSGTGIGCDLEMIEPRTDPFTDDYLTAREQTFVAQTPAEQRPLLVNLLWSAKESALKALHEGLRIDTTLVDVRLGDSSPSSRVHSRRDLALGAVADSGAHGWRSLEVCYRDEPRFHGWWRHADHMVRTIVSTNSLYPPSSCASPASIEITTHCFSRSFPA